MNDQNTIDSILESVGGDVLALTVGKVLKSGQKDAFMPKAEMRKRFGLGAALCNRVHYALKRQWGTAKGTAEKQSANKGNLVLESTKHMPNGKVHHVYAPIKKPVAGRRVTRRATPKQGESNVITLLAGKLGKDVSELEAMLKAS